MNAISSLKSQFQQFHVDASMARELRTLEAGAVTTARMAKAILRGLADLDAHGASSELETLKRWTRSNLARLGPGARRVVSAYVRVADRAAADGQSGLSRARMAKLRSVFERVAASGAQPERPTRPAPPVTQPDAPRRGDVPHSVAEANAFFKRQGFSAKWNNFYRDARSRAGDLSHNGNCGPTSLAMAVAAFGLEPKGITAQASIDRSRLAMTGHLEDDDGTTQAQHERGAKKLGLNAERINPNTLDDQLAKGRMVVLVGRAQGAYKAAMKRTDPSYSLGPLLHAITVMGRDSAGYYLVADPMSRRGVARMTRAEIFSYFRGQTSCSSTAVWK